jgi:hypothetical protein
MINLSFRPEDPADRPPAAADPAYWRRAVRAHCDPAAAAPIDPPPPPPCRRCRHAWPCAARRRAERALFRALRELRRDRGWDDGWR